MCTFGFDGFCGDYSAVAELAKFASSPVAVTLSGLFISSGGTSIVLTSSDGASFLFSLDGAGLSPSFFYFKIELLNFGGFAFSLSAFFFIETIR